MSDFSVTSEQFTAWLRSYRRPRKDGTRGRGEAVHADRPLSLVAARPAAAGPGYIAAVGSRQ